MVKPRKNLKFFLYSNFEKFFSYMLASLLPFSLLNKAARSHLIFPYYHLVSDKKNIPHVKHLFNHRNVNEFKKDIDFFLQNYSSLELMDLIKSTKEHKTLPKDCFLLTFDDGYREIYDIVAPILKNKGVPAIFF